MTHLEPVEPRRLLTNTGLDVHFGVKGVAVLPSRQYTVQSVLATKTAVFVDATVYVPVGDEYDTDRFVLKYTSRGKLDTGWGKNGRIAVDDAVGALPASTLARLETRPEMAYDDTTGQLYVLSQSPKYEGNSLAVERLTATGKPDTTYGTAGVATTIIPAVAADGSGIAVRFQAMALLGRGKVLIAFDNGLGTDLTLLRLNAKGTADTAYGQSGFALVAAGSEAFDGEDLSSSLRESLPVFGDWQIRSDGSVRVVDLRENLKLTSVNDNPEDIYTLSASQYVETHVVSSAGAEQPTLARTFTLAHDAYGDAPGNRGRAFRPVLVTADGDDGVAVVGARAVGDLYQPASFTIPGDRLTVVRYTAAGRQSPVGLAVPDGGTFHGVAKGTDRVVFFTGSHATAFDTDLTVDAAFGRHGTVQADEGTGVYAIDPDGRVLAAIGTELLRFDGV